MNRFRPIILIVAIAVCCTFIGYAVYRIGNSGSNSTNVTESNEKPARQKNLDWLQEIEGIKEEDTSSTTTPTETTATSTDNETETSITPTSTQNLDDPASPATTTPKEHSKS